MSGWDPTSFPLAVTPGPHHELLDISPDGQELLLSTVKGALSSYDFRPDIRYLSEGFPWATRIVDGSSRRVENTLARDAVPAGWNTDCLYGWRRPHSGIALRGVEQRDAVRKLLELKGVDILVPCRSADSNRQRDSVSQRRSAWQSESMALVLRKSPIGSQTQDRTLRDVTIP